MLKTRNLTEEILDILDNKNFQFNAACLMFSSIIFILFYLTLLGVD